MKKLTALLLLALMAVSLVAAQGKLVIRLGHIRDTNHPSHMAALKFKELVEAGSQGRIEVKVFPNSQLGDPKQMFVLMQTGDLEMVYGGINTFAWIKGGEPYEITATPFLFKDYDHMRRSMQADFFKPIQEKAEKSTGIKIVNINGDTAPRGLSTRDRPVVKAEDFKGLKVRTAASPTVLRAMQALGALPQQIAFSELYMALKTGVVDAQENGAIVVASSSLYEVQKYYTKTDYIRDIETFYMAADKWNKLSAADKDLILKATEIAGNLETTLTQKQLTDVYDFLKTKMTVLEADLSSIQAKLQGVYDDYEGSKWPAGLLAKIKSIQNN
ncbi:MAG: TRAP transporter substrate-binding protein [Spirochaetales bacterium]